MPEWTINDLVNEAIQGWARLIGLDENGEITGDNPWQAYHLHEHTEGLNESRRLDPTGLTTFMMLRGLVERYLKDVTFDAYSLILDPKSIGARLKPMKELKDILEAPQVVALIEGFQEQVRGAALQYGVRSSETLEGLDNLLKDRFDLAYIRRDALLSMYRLEAHQFTQGVKDPNPLKFNPQVFEFWNVNSLLAAMRGQKMAGITMCLIRDPEEALNSYFVFAIRNGGTMTILTDREKTPHPAFNRMSRRPDRLLDRRMARNWFPYSLLGIKKHEDELGEVKRLSVNARTQLVPINIEAVPLKDVRDLTAEEFVWTTLVFDLIREKHWKEDFRVPELSYTGEMVVEPAALVGNASALVKDGLYKPLEVPPLKAADVTAESTREQWDDEPTGFNTWMVERYGSQVPDEVLNPVGSQAKLLLEERVNSGELLPILNDRWGKPVKSELETLNPVTFGTKSQIEKDRIWVARVNQVKVIQRLADEEYERERAGVIEWYSSHVRKNLEFLCNAAAHGELLLPDWKPRTFGGVRVTMDEPHESESDRMVQSNRVDQRVGARWSRAFPYIYFDLPQCRFGEHEDKRDFCCERTDRAASVFTVIKPTCPEALAILCGVKVEDLPWPLQHWYAEAPYYGNSILNRLDPEDWELKNPWMPDRGAGGLRLMVGLAHSKLALHARRKALGLPRREYEEKEAE